MFAPLHCLNFGISGDQTQNVLWRVMNGEMKNMSPQVSAALPPNSHIRESWRSHMKYFPLVPRATIIISCCNITTQSLKPD